MDRLSHPHAVAVGKNRRVGIFNKIMERSSAGHSKVL
jgi:hypothetical protein